MKGDDSLNILSGVATSRKSLQFLFCFEIASSHVRWKKLVTQTSFLLEVITNPHHCTGIPSTWNGEAQHLRKMQYSGNFSNPCRAVQRLISRAKWKWELYCSTHQLTKCPFCLRCSHTDYFQSNKKKMTGIWGALQKADDITTIKHQQ